MKKSRTFAMGALLLPAFLFVFSTSHAQSTEDTLTLEYALQHTLQNNPFYRAAQEEMNKTRELYPQARAGWLPTLSAEVGLSASNIESSNFGSADGATTKDIGVSLNQPIWRGGQTFAETDRAEDLIKAGIAILKQKEQEILLESITAYVNVLYDQELLDLRRDNVRLLSDELKSTEERLEMGAITKTDVHQAQTRLSKATSRKLQAETMFHNSLMQFEQTVGMPAPLNLAPPAPDFGFPATVEEMHVIADKQNPEIIIAQFQKRAAGHNIDATFRKLFPQISASASYNKQFDPQPGLVDQSSNETIGIRATLLLFQGGKVRSQTREAEKEHKRLEHIAKSIERRVKQAISSNWYAYLSAKEQAKNRRNEVETAKIARNGVQMEAKEGQRSILDILDADQELIDAQTSLVNAKKNELLAQYTLASKLGLLAAKYEAH